MRKIISAIALLSLLGQTAQASDNISTPPSQGITVSSIGGMPQSYHIEAKPIAPLECHINPASGIDECQAAPQHDAHVQDWQRQSPAWKQMGFKSQADLDRWYDAADRAKAKMPAEIALPHGAVEISGMANP